MRSISKALASLTIAGMALSSVPFNALASETVPSRLAGMNAAQTAVKIADQTGWTGKAVLASSAAYGMVDALTSGPLASYLNAPILLQGPGATLDADTKAELLKLNVDTVYVTSGTAVISQGVLDELDGMDITVVALGGSDRFQTSVNIAKKMVELGATVDKVAVAYGWLNQDALSIASIASAQTEPILLTEKDAMPDSVKAFLTANASVAATDVIGGTAVISDDLKAKFPEATRYFGKTAYDTNLEVLKAFDEVLDFDHVFVANGQTAIDALAGAPLAAQFNAGIVLSNGAANEATTYVSGKLTAASQITALGGTAVVPDSVLADMIDAKAAAAAKAAAIEKIDSIAQDGDASGITGQDLLEAGVTAADMLDANLAAYRDAISAAADLALNSTEKIQQMVTDVNAAEAQAAAIAKIEGIAVDGDASTVTTQDLLAAGVTAADVLEANLAAYRDAVSAAADLALDSTAKIQQMVTAVNAAEAEALRAAAVTKIDGIELNGNASAISAQDLIAAGVTAADVLEANLAAYQTAVSVAADLALDSTEKIQQMVTAVNAAQAAEALKTAAIAKIDGIAVGAAATDVSLQDLLAAGVTAEDVLEANLVAYQTAISAAADLGLDSTEEIQQMVTSVNAAQSAE